MRQRGEKRRVFVTLTGQADNLGDIVLRRDLVEAVRQYGELHALVGNTPAAFHENICRPEDVLYRNKAEWQKACLTKTDGYETVYFDKPGEYLGGRLTLDRMLSAYRFLRSLRRRGARMFFVGIGLRDVKLNLFRRFALRAILAQFHLVAWRDTGSLRSIKTGRSMPDWAFAGGSVETAGEGQKTRDKLVVSLRDDRPFPSSRWLASVKDCAARNSLKILVVWQVGRDSGKARLLAEALDGTVLDVEGMSPSQTEAGLRAAYGSAALVISDRLHVLILAATEGAMPLCLSEWNEIKVGRHFDAIGFEDVSHDVTNADAAAIGSIIDTQMTRSEELKSAMTQANSQLIDIRETIEKLVGQ